METLVLWLTEEYQGPNKEPRLLPCIESSLNINRGWLVYKKYDDVIFTLMKENGESIELPIGSEITDDLKLAQS